MRILIVGSGGREHALAWKIAQSPWVKHTFVAPGNGGTALEPNVENVSIAATDVQALLQFAKEALIDLTIVGPEAPLAQGIVDLFTQESLRCFGPTRNAAQLESSKAFSKAFMLRHGIPTAHYASFTDIHAASAYVKTQSLPIVIKADGLAAGKGVIIAQTETEALTAIQQMLTPPAHQNKQPCIVIEEFLQGEEASFMVIANGQQVLPLATSQDHKTRDNGDQGPNTGGMGAYSPALIVTPALHEQIMTTIIRPTLAGMAAEGYHYNGFLYAGLMITPKGEAKVLEFNCRLGDPETQPILCRLKSDLLETCLAAIENRLDTIKIEWDPRPALGVVIAAQGYPDHYPTGDTISKLPKEINQNYKIFHAGTQLEAQQIITSGGRVLCVTALGDTVSAAQKHAYELIKEIYWPHMYYRTDIGHRAIAKEL